MIVLSLNAGSSTIKFKLIETQSEATLASGNVHIRHQGEIQPAVADALACLPAGSPPAAIGHRVVQGGDLFRAATTIDDRVEAALATLHPLAPLHSPVNLAGIQAARALCPKLPQVAVFDTAFHATIPPAAYTYALPQGLAQRWKIRRYGFHGISHSFISQRYAALSRRPAKDLKLITLHLGNGCSACAIRGGRSVDTSMGLTPMEGLVMGTRPGDLDPAILFRLMEWEGMGPEEAERMLNQDSGLKGISGLSNDMRELETAAESGDERAGLAIDVFCHRVRRYLGAYHAELNGVDAVLVAGGIGENSPGVRSRICSGLDALGIEIDSDANRALRGSEGRISSPESRTAVWVVPTNEELMIARETALLLQAATAV